MGVLERVGASLLWVGRRIDPQNRAQVWGAIVLFWVGSLIISILVGLWWTHNLVRSIVANLVADLLVAGVIFVGVDVIFGFSRQQEEKTEAISKATYMLASEIEMNKKDLVRIIEDFEKGSYPSPRPKLETENWELFVQGPLPNLIPSDLFWVLQEAYWVPKKTLETYESRASPAMAVEAGRELLPQFREALALVSSADDALRAAYVQE